MTRIVRWPFLAALVLTLALAVYSLAPASPETILNDKMLDPQPFKCPSGVTALLAFSERHDAKIYLTKHRFILVEFGNDGTVARITLGKWSEVDGKVVVRDTQTLTLDQTLALYPSPCDFLAPREA